ncbi:MAG: AAA family ATPase [Desulfobacterota bacterium]|nr:AAA family ATPase [Thermodesulfobacteriota bacterium]
MGTIIAVAGKGGTGKTTVAALLIRYCRDAGMVPVLAVDADPDANLPEALGIAATTSISTVGDVCEAFAHSKETLPQGMPKEAFFELSLHQALVETENIDLLVMGRPEGAGCYCYINNVLRKYLDVLPNSYCATVIDNEAGLEHLSRRTTRNTDNLLIVSDYSLNGLRAAVRIRQLANELRLDIGCVGLVVNKVTGTISDTFLHEVKKTGVPLCGVIPFDPLLQEQDVHGTPVIALPHNTPSYGAVCKIARKLLGDRNV